MRFLHIPIFKDNCLGHPKQCNHEHLTRLSIQGFHHQKTSQGSHGDCCLYPKHPGLLHTNIRGHRVICRSLFFARKKELRLLCTSSPTKPTTTMLSLPILRDLLKMILVTPIETEWEFRRDLVKQIELWRRCQHGLM